MIKSKGILTISIISLFAVESAYAAIASSGYVDQQVGTKISEVNATTVANDETANVVTSISAEGNTVTATKGITAEETANKVTTIRTDGTATDIAYPSEKAVATALDAKQDKLEGEVLTNTATGSGSVSTGGANVAATTDSVVIGNGSSVADSSNSSVVVGYGSSVASDANNSSVFGASASSSGRTGVAIGSFAQVTEDAGVAVGFGAVAGNGSIALGGGAVSSAEHAIQLGQGENNEANTLGVGFSTLKNYKLLGSDGKIPAERLPFEGDVLTNTATGSNSVSTGEAVSVSAEKAVGLGYLADGSGTGAIAIGRETLASDVNSVGIGSWAEASGPAAISIGDSSAATKNSSIAIGNGASASGESSIAIGDVAVTSGDGSIQLGYGTNSEANTLSVGLGSSNNYKLLGSDGKIPAERLPFTGDVLTNTATGTDSFSTGGANVTTGNSSLAIGVDAATGSSGEVAVGAAAMSGGYASVAVGNAADATGGNAVAVGQNSLADSMNSTAVGQGAKSTATYAIQLGAGTNSEANTFSVALSDANNYKLLGSDGKIPAERLPFTGDVLTNTATGSYSFSTGNASPASAGSAVAIGENATVQSGGTAIGYLTSSGASGVALGARASSNKMGGVSVGFGSAVEGDMGIAVGTGAQSAGGSSISIGVAAKAQANYAVQLGSGTNSEANTLSVGLDGTNNYKLLGSDGKIPAERLPVATSSTLGGVKSGGDISISSTGAVSVVSALKAVQDANGANIAATYATKNSVEDLQANKVKVDWTTSNVNKVLVIGSDSNYPDVYGKVTVAKITENFLDNAIKNKLSNAVTSVATSGSGAVVTGFSKSGNSMTVTKSNVKIPVGSATATTYATIWVE